VTFLRRAVVALAAPAVAAVALASPAQAAVPTNDIVKLGTCKSGGVHFEARAEWQYTYTAGGVLKARIDRVEWSIQDPDASEEPGDQPSAQGTDAAYNQDADTTEYAIKSYNGNTRIPTLRDEDADVYYANVGENGELWFGRNPANPPVATNSRVVLYLGKADDGAGKCSIVFRIPAELGPKIAE
jgi:hypothetical protein